jgi:hypothetical protein
MPYTKRSPSSSREDRLALMGTLQGQIARLQRQVVHLTAVYEELRHEITGSRGWEALGSPLLQGNADECTQETGPQTRDGLLQLSESTVSGGCYRARRWVVERTHSWLNRFPRLLIRREKKVENYVATLHFACAWITFRAPRVLDRL